MVSLEHYLITGLPIPLGDGLGTIYQPTIKEILSNKMTVDDFLQPFLIRVDLLNNTEIFEGFAQKINDFDLLFLQESDGNFLFTNGGYSILGRLIECLKLLYNTKSVELSFGEQVIKIDNKYIIDRNNFTYLADIILEVFDTEKPKPKDDKPKYKDKARQMLWEKLERRRAEEAQKKALTMADIINIVVHIDNYIDYSKVVEMTYFQLLNTYKTFMNKMSYDEYLMFKSSGQFDLKQDQKHWTTENKVKKSTIQI